MARPSLIACALVFPCMLAPLSFALGSVPSLVTPAGNGGFRASEVPSRTRITSVATLTPQSDDFASGNGIGTVGGTAGLRLDPGGASDNMYTVHFFVTVSINGSSTYGSSSLLVAIETNDGSGWVERGSYYYNCGYLSGQGPYAARTCPFSHEQQVITVGGLGLADSIRLKAKSFTPPGNGAGGSWFIRGGDGAGSNPETYNGVTYTRDIVPTTLAQSDSFASGNGIATVGGTAGLQLDPGGAFDNTYTVHFFVTVSINGSSTYGSSSLVVAIETNDGSGWVERGSYYYNCGYLSGQGPYAARTCPFSHEQQVITVGGLVLGDSIRLKAKSFTPPGNGAGGSWFIRGGDAGGSNPETYSGVTYATPIVILRGVAVRAELPERQGFTGTTLSQRFFVKNRGEVDATLGVGYSCTGAASCSGTPGTFMNVPPGDSRVVTLSYGLGTTAGTTGTGMVKVFDAFDNNALRDSASVTVTAVGAPAPVASVVDVNPGATLRRDLCVTIAAGPAAAIECGDLRIVHALPTIRTLNKSRTPTLLYNSAHAELFAVVPATVTLPSSGTLPDSVQGVFKRGAVTVVTGRWGGSDWTLGATRRIALAWAVSPDTVRPDTVYDYTFEATAIYPPPTGPQATAVNGKLIVVDRRGTGFGAGWSLAGLERIRSLANGDKLWVGGDGSARIYQSTPDPNVWVAPADSRPDTLKKVSGGQYYRVVPGGAKVWFSTVGQHDSTVNRLGQRTAFGYSTNLIDGLLTSITLPTAGGGQSYSFVYDSSAPPKRVVTITAPGARITTMWLSSMRVDSIGDPDNTKVRFTYENGTSRRIASRTDRRGTVTSYNYDVAKKLWRVHTDLQPDSIRLGFAAVDNLGLFTASPKTAIDTANAYTAFYGPRQYATRPSDQVSQQILFYTDRFGATRRLRDALSQWTTVRREDGQWPTLPTDFIDAAAFETRASYDGRGNLIRQVAVQPLAPAQSADAITRYHWDPLWDAVDSIITPMGVVTTMAYNPHNGNRLFQQVGPDVNRRVSFNYGNADSLLSSVVVQAIKKDSVVYDGQRNVAGSRTARGFWTSYYKDALGRDTLVVTPIDSTDKEPRGGAADSTIRLRQRTVFTVMDRDSIVETIAPNRGEEVRVDQRYDSAGNVLSLARVSIPDPTNPAIGTITTQWRYDRANRRVAEVAPDGMKDSTDYDPAGNVAAAVTRRKDPSSGTRLTINMTYDARNQLVRRVRPPITYQSRPTGFVIQHNQGGNWTALPYPAYPIPAETDTFTYDPLGRLLTADNANARVKRIYYPAGLLKLDSLRIQTVAQNDWEAHKYGLRSIYDLDGRRDTLYIPSQLRAGNDTAITYAYDPQVGLLQTLKDLQRNPYTLGYDVQGNLSSIAYPGSYREGLRYDPDGQLAADTIWNDVSPGSYPRIQGYPLVRATSFFYDARHKLQLSGDAIQLMDSLRPTYTGLGNLKSTTWTEWGCISCALLPGDRHKTGELFTLDAFGNVTLSFVGDTLHGQRYTPWHDEWHYQTDTTCCDTLSYQPGTGRMTRTAVADQYPRSFYYDSSGNQVFSSAVDPDNVNTHPATERASFFAADGSLRMVDARAAFVSHPFQPNEWQTYAVEDYRYDALGRRVWVRARRWCDDTFKTLAAGTQCRVGVLRRIIWDGDQELAEIQMPWAIQALYDTAQNATWWENDVTPLSTRPTLPLLSTWAGNGDPNPYFGHVIYAGRRGVDQPMAITRVNYVMGQDWTYPSPARPAFNPPRLVAPFTIVPFWNAQGDAPVGVFSNGYQWQCGDPGHDTSCVAIRWPWNWSSADRNGGLPHDYWHGTLLEGKRDNSGFRYMRNRYYDPLTGRFTQEDPIGLAGGLNTYGFARGDPVNFADPFGLKVCLRGTKKVSTLQIANLMVAVGQATNADIVWENDCVKSWTARPGKGWEEIQSRFGFMVKSPETATVEWGSESFVPSRTLRAVIAQADLGKYVVDSPYDNSLNGLLTQTCGSTVEADFTYGSLVAHELLGHVYNSMANVQAIDQDEAIRIENQYHAAQHEAQRCFWDK